MAGDRDVDDPGRARIARAILGGQRTLSQAGQWWPAAGLCLAIARRVAHTALSMDANSHPLGVVYTKTRVLTMPSWRARYATDLISVLTLISSDHEAGPSQPLTRAALDHLTTR